MILVFVAWCIVYIGGWLFLGVALSSGVLLASMLVRISGYHINFCLLLPVDMKATIHENQGNLAIAQPPSQTEGSNESGFLQLEEL